MKEEIIKEFREKFDVKNLDGTEHDFIKESETFWLSKLASQKKELLEKIDEYFKNLIVIPDPQATLESLKEQLK